MLEECLTELAKKYPQSKFVKIISTECIPNYPDKNVPTVLIYKDTQCLQHLIGLAPFGGPRTTPERESQHIAVAATYVTVVLAVHLQHLEWSKSQPLSCYNNTPT